MECSSTYGGYYNYCAASAGTVCQNTSAQNASQDICPVGWRLPSDSELTGIAPQVSALSPVYGGRYENGSPANVGNYGYLWSRIAIGDNVNAYYLLYSGGGLYTGTYKKYSGFSIRCIKS